MPETLRFNLLMASLYLSAFEILRTSVTERIESFFTFGYENGHTQRDDEYQKVVALHSSPFQASLLWLQQNDAITIDDIQMIDEIRRHRNDLAHQLPRFLSDVNRNINIENFENIRYLLKKIEIWWIREVDIPTNADFDGVEVKDEDIQPGSVIVLDAIIRMALEGAE